MRPCRFRLEQIRRANTSVELYALGAALRHIEETELIRPDIASLSDFAIAIHKQAIRDIQAMYGTGAVDEANKTTPLVVAYQKDKRRIVIQPGDPLATIVRIG
jgi:hypothetical protein